MNPGDRYGRYQAIRLLGRGAMGEVYLARDTETQRQIALKIVYKGPDREDQEVVDAERFGAEIQKRLSGYDRRVARVNRYGEINGDLFIEMEYIEGEDLSTILGRGPVAPGFATHISIELCEMLENLTCFTTTIAGREFTGIIHGDLKPRNVRLNAQNQVKVLDFGIAKALSQTRKYTMNVFASTAYCSPERLETQNMDSHSDLWSLGVLMYQMLAGHLPFEEPTKERLERRIRSSAPPEPLAPTCPEPLGRIIFKMLARDPGRRYQSATELKEDLARFRRGDAVLAAAPEFDNDATIRTGPLPPPSGSGGAADDGTVRTMLGPAKAAPIVWPPKGQRNQTALGCMAVLAGALLVLFIFAIVQWNFWNDASRLKADLKAERVTDLNDAWNRYQALANRSHLGILLWGAKDALKKRLIAAADDVILDYRNNDAPSVGEPEWVRAKNDLARALELDPDDNQVKGRLRLCEGHLDRIYADRLRSPARQRQLNVAAAKFNEASELLKKSPDPYLGLARLYVYDMNDMDRAEDALKKADKYGHPMGKRETAQLADGYLRRGDRFWRQALGMTQNLQQEREYLDKAHDDYLHAAELYQRVGLFGDAPRNQNIAIQDEQKVEQRLNELQTRTIGSNEGLPH